MHAALKVKEHSQEEMLLGRGVNTTYDLSARRTALVMGGVSGIGSAICKKLADLGHFVAATYHNEVEARAWQDKMEREGYLFYIYKYDTCSFEKSCALVEDVTADLGPIQILVNNADVDGLDSVSHVTHAVIESMLATGFGRVVNISSVKEKSRGSGGYFGAKKSIHGITQALAQEVASKGITVNMISPGYVATEMILSMPNHIRSIEAQIPAGRLGRPEDVAHVVSFLVSEESGFINGANIAAHGGYLIN